MLRDFVKAVVDRLLESEHPTHKNIILTSIYTK